MEKLENWKKLISMMTVHKSILKEVKRHWCGVHFDMIVGTSPYMFDSGLVAPLKRYYQCPAFLILWDLFPQNAKDLGLIKSKLVFSYFKHKEKRNLISFDYIGCQSPGNLSYMKENYPYLRSDSLYLFPQWSGSIIKGDVNRLEVRKKYNFQEKDFLLIFGGNMGLPQNLINIVDIAYEMQDQEKIKFIFVGNGTEKEKLKRRVQELGMQNVTFIDSLNRFEYQKLLGACDVGLISLDPRFTFPNFPSKILDYLRSGLPIVALLDQYALSDSGRLIRESRFGFASGSNKEFESSILKLFHNRSICNEFSENGKRHFIENCNVSDRYDYFIDIIKS